MSELLGRYEVMDIETYRKLALFSFYNPTTDEWNEFEISDYKNELYEFVKWYREEPIDYVVGFNSLGFDSQVIEHVLRHYQEWWDMNTDDVILAIYNYSQSVINRSKLKQWLDYREWDFRVKQIDLFKIWHYDREQRSTGLKKLEFSMDFENVEDLPYDHTSLFLTEEQIADIRLYCRNDIKATCQFLKYTLGDCEHSLYKGDNKIEMRMHLKDEFKLSSINLSDTKIGDEIIIQEYCKIANIKPNQLPNKGRFRANIAVKDCIPKYIKFNTRELNDFMYRKGDGIYKKVLKQTEDFSEELQFKGQRYDFKKGGLHNVITGKYYTTNDEMMLLDLDVTGYYPRIMLNNQYAPAHLKKDVFIKALEVIVNRREELKPLAVKDSKVKGIVQGLKIAANSVFGKTSDMHSWMFDKLTTMQTTLTGELSLLMLIESLEISGINVIMANTDGIMIYTERSKLTELNRVADEWMTITGFNLEQSEFEFIAFSTVNDYIGRKTDGKMKVKGDFLQHSELHGDKSRRVVRLALYEYYTKGADVETFIRNHTNIFDFVIGVKATSKYKFLLGGTHVNGVKQGYHKELNKMTRYYISNKGEVLLKKNKDKPEHKGGINTESEDKVYGHYQPKVTYFNKYVHYDDFSLYDVDYDYYIIQAKAIILKVGTGRKPAKQHFNPLQTSMF